MGYLYLTCVALMFSFGGTCVKLISPYFGVQYIVFFRFFFGVCWLLVLKKIMKQKFRRDFMINLKALGGWIVFGALAKWLAYLTENYALTHGPSYGNIVVQPAQTIFVTMASVFLFKEKISKKQMLCILLCTLGVLSISWNGRSLEEFFGENILLTGIFLLSGVFAGGHVLTQKIVADQMDIIDSNLSIFLISAVLSFFPLTPDIAAGKLNGVHPSPACILAILAFGFITGIGFYLNAKAIPMVPFYIVPVIQSMMAIFAIIWGVLFFHETVTVYIVAGTVIFLLGLIGLQLLKDKT